MTGIELKMHTLVASIYLHEVSLYEELWEGHDSQRLDAAYACMHSVKEFVVCFMELHNHLLFLHLYSTWAQLAYVLLMCSRLSLLRFPGWTAQTSKQVIDFPAALDDLYAKLTQAAQLASYWRKNTASPTTNLLHEQRPDEVLMRTANKILSVKTWYLRFTHPAPSSPTAAQDWLAAEPDNQMLSAASYQGYGLRHMGTVEPGTMFTFEDFWADPFGL